MPGGPAQPARWPPRRTSGPPAPARPTISELSRKLLALGDEGVRADEASWRRCRAWLSTVAPIPMRRVLADRAAVQDGVVADGAAGADRQRRAHVGVQQCAFLDVGPLPDIDELVVAAQDSAEPDAHIDAEAHTADHMGVRSDPVPSLAGTFGSNVVEAVDAACVPSSIPAQLDGPRRRPTSRRRRASARRRERAART